MSSTAAVDGSTGGDGEAAAPPRSRRLTNLSNAAVGIGLVLLVGGFLLAVLEYRPFSVPTDSMAPTVSPGDRVIAQRIDGDEVRRGDVVVFEDPVWGDVSMLKRVIAVGGDTVACCDDEGRLTINGVPVREPYLGGGRASLTEFEATVPEGRLFLLGDNRGTSQDSRMHLADHQGTVPASSVTARMDGTVWPPSRMGFGGHEEAFGVVGPVSAAGPLRWLVVACLSGSVLILGGAAAGPVADRVGRRGSARRSGG